MVIPGQLESRLLSTIGDEVKSNWNSPPTTSDVIFTIYKSIVRNGSTRSPFIRGHLRIFTVTGTGDEVARIPVIRKSSCHVSPPCYFGVWLVGVDEFGCSAAVPLRLPLLAHTDHIQTPFGLGSGMVHESGCVQWKITAGHTLVFLPRSETAELSSASSNPSSVQSVLKSVRLRQVRWPSYGLQRHRR